MNYVISDIHGDLDTFNKILSRIKLSENDRLFVLGDVVDKGEKNLALYQAVMKEKNICLLKGNHEYLLERYIRGEVSADLYDACGGRTTRLETDRLSEEKKRRLVLSLESLELYKEINVGGTDYFLTHSGCNADYCLRRREDGKVDIKASVVKAIEADQEKYLFSNDLHYIPKDIVFDKRIIVGHFPTLCILDWEKPKIYYGKKYIDIDTGNENRKGGGRLACLRLEDGKEFYV